MNLIVFICFFIRVSIGATPELEQRSCRGPISDILADDWQCGPASGAKTTAFWQEAQKNNRGPRVAVVINGEIV